jgi:hypothetical protein
MTCLMAACFFFRKERRVAKLARELLFGFDAKCDFTGSRAGFERGVSSVISKISISFTLKVDEPVKKVVPSKQVVFT